MDVVLFALAIAVAGWGGLGVTLLLADRAPDGSPDQQPLGAVAVLCLSFLFGTALVSLSSFVIGVATGVTTRPVATVVCVAVGAAGVWVQRVAVAGWLRRLPRVRPSPIGAGVLIVSLLMTVTTWRFARRIMLGWDGLHIWEFKARLAFDHGGTVPAASFRDTTRMWSHVDYPQFLPLTETWVYGWLRRPDQEALVVLFPLFLLVACGLLWVGVRLLGTSRTVAPALAVVALLAIPFVTFGEGSASSGYADVPLATWFLAAVVFGIHHIRSGSAQSLRFAVAAAAVLPWVKREGTVLLGCFVVLLCLALVARRAVGMSRWSATWRSVVTVGGPGFAVFLMWRAYLAHVDVAPHAEYLPITFDRLRDNFDRTSVIANAVWEEATRWEQWSLLWPMVLLAAVVWAVRHRGVERVLLPGLVLVPIAVSCSVYYFSGWNPVIRHIEASLPRLMLQVAPVAVLLLALAVPARAPAMLEPQSPVD